MVLVDILVWHDFGPAPGKGVVFLSYPDAPSAIDCISLSMQLLEGQI
jgi:hypothetical protein